MLPRNAAISICMTTSHTFIPFSTSFLPKVTLNFYKSGQQFMVQTEIENAKSHGLDDRLAKIWMVYNPEYRARFGCEVQVLFPKLKVHTNLHVGRVSSSRNFRLPKSAS